MRPSPHLSYEEILTEARRLNAAQQLRLLEELAAAIRRNMPDQPASMTKPQQEEFTDEDFESALDKASRPIKGRFAHLPYSSEQFIQEKREEVELEERSS